MNRTRQQIRRWGALAALSALVCGSHSAEVAPRPGATQARPFPLEDVRLLTGPFKQAQDLNGAYLLSLDVDRLLHVFRLNVGLSTSARPLGGWERPECELRGHSVGHYLSAVALAYASSGDRRFHERAHEIVAGFAACQAAARQKGFHPGYLSAFPESFIDRVENRRPVWAPWYTLHKIMAGLLDAHAHCADAQALEVLLKMVDWVNSRVDGLTPAQMQASLETEFGGMNEVLANLYALTGNPDHLRLARAFDHHKISDPLAEGVDRLDGLHANTQIPKFIGWARLYEVAGDPRDRRVAEFAWDRVALHRSYVNGGHSDREHFFPTSTFAQHLSTETTETCNTYNMLKLTQHVFGWEPSAATMDFYERGLYNHILASQDPRTGMYTYLVPMKPGHFKTYSRPLDSFWCCVGTGMENHVKYGDTIYFHDDESLYVNLFIASELRWKAKAMVVRQETTFPESDRVRLTLQCERPTTATFRIRHPGWAGANLEVRVNGKRVEVPTSPGSYLSLPRTWKDGDRVEWRVPMGLRAENLPGATNYVAFLYGPILLAGELGREGIESVSPYVKDQLDLARYSTPSAPVLVGDSNDRLPRIQAVPGEPLCFRTQGLMQPTDVRLIPFYRLHHQRYAVYWAVQPQP